MKRYLVFFAILIIFTVLFSKGASAKCLAPCNNDPNYLRINYGCVGGACVLNIGCTTDHDCQIHPDLGPGYLCKIDPIPANNRCVSALGNTVLKDDKIGGYEASGSGLRSLINNVTFAVGSIVGLIFMSILILGGIAYMTASGDDKALTKAKQQLTAGIIGLLIVFMAWWVLKIVSVIFGINLLQPSFTGP